MADSQFWRSLALSFRQLLASCKQPLNVEWRAIRPTPVAGRIDAWVMIGDGGGNATCAKRFSDLGAKGGQTLSPSHPNKIETWLNALAGYSRPLPPKAGQGATDSRFEDVVRISAEYCERRADAEGASERPSLAVFVIENFRYFPTHLLEKHGPKQWARLRILQACERLDIPAKLWPKFPFPEPPRPQQHHYRVIEQLSLPSFFPLYESEAEWKNRVESVVDAFMEKELDRFRAILQRELKDKTLTPIKQTRETTPLELRYEWTAKRICYRTPYRELAKEESDKGYTEQRIKEAVNTIIREAGLRQAK